MALTKKEVAERAALERENAVLKRRIEVVERNERIYRDKLRVVHRWLAGFAGKAGKTPNPVYGLELIGQVL